MDLGRGQGHVRILVAGDLPADEGLPPLLVAVEEGHAGDADHDRAAGRCSLTRLRGPQHGLCSLDPDKEPTQRLSPLTAKESPVVYWPSSRETFIGVNRYSLGVHIC